MNHHKSRCTGQDSTAAQAGTPRSARAGSWTWIDNAVIDLIPHIGGTAFSVYAILAKHASSANQTCWPSKATLARALGVTTPTVKRAINTLVRTSLISRQRQRSPTGGDATNLYLLHDLPPDGEGITEEPVGDHVITREGITREPERGSTVSPKPDPFQPHLIQPDPTNPREQAGARLSARADAHEMSGVEPCLLDLIDRWNAIAPEIRAPTIRRDPPPKELLKVWKRLSKDRDLRAGFSDIPALIAAIRNATWCHGKGWFTLPWLFTKSRDTNELRVRKILNGAYESHGTSKCHARASDARFLHDPANPLSDVL